MIILAVILIVTVFIVVSGKSYAYFEKSVEGSCVALQVGNLSYESETKIILESLEKIKFDLIVKGNDDTAGKYQVYYKSNNDLTSVIAGYYYKTVDLPSGDIAKSEKKTVTVSLENNSDNTVEIVIGVKSGLANNTIEDIILEEGEYRLDRKIEKETILVGGIPLEVNETVKNMFNYSSEGCIMDVASLEQTCPVDATNGIYTIDDNDGISYYYRGQVDNLIQFGEYTKDYYVYRYNNLDFVSLDACKWHNLNCSEDNKVLKYSRGTPMYWKIIRVNGDKTIRMIYSGTLPDATGYETGIGLSKYNKEYDEAKYTGYTYDRTITEVGCDAKTEIDNWYANVFEGTEYNNKIVTGKFCSDSSGYELFSENYYIFSVAKRNLPKEFGLGENSAPTFKCTSTNATFGGSYNLKAGLITIDEIVAAGGQLASNNSFYLYNGTEDNYDGKWFWSLSPVGFDNVTAFVSGVNYDGYVYKNGIQLDIALLRPVINLRADVTFKSGTEGTLVKPYIVE